jgi:hypothetical protein
MSASGLLRPRAMSGWSPQKRAITDIARGFDETALGVHGLANYGRDVRHEVRLDACRPFLRCATDHRTSSGLVARALGTRAGEP